VNLNH